MQLEQYFATTKGTGVFATCDGKGEVNTAIYGRPHVQSRDEVVFIMLDRRSHANLADNPHACYLFLEEGKAYQGVRLYLTFLDDSTDQERIRAMSRRPKRPDEGEQERKFLVRFRVDKALNLLGGERKELE